MDNLHKFAQGIYLKKKQKTIHSGNLQGNLLFQKIGAELYNQNWWAMGYNATSLNWKMLDFLYFRLAKMGNT